MNNQVFVESVCSIIGAFLLSFSFPRTINPIVIYTFFLPILFISLLIITHALVQIIRKKRVKHNILFLFIGIFFAIFMISMLISNFYKLNSFLTNITSIVGLISFIVLAILIILICDCEDKRK